MVFDFSSLQQSFGLRKGSPYTEFLNKELVKLKQIGMIPNALSRDTIKSNCPSQETDGDGASPVIFEKVVLPFTILLMGAVFAVVFMILEMCCRNL